MPSLKPLKEHVPVDSKERKDERKQGKKEAPSRSPEAETEEPRAPRRQNEDLLFQSQQSWIGGPAPCQGHGALSRRAGSGI